MRWMLMALALAGCKKKVVEAAGPQAPRGIDHPDLPCKEGTIGAGNPPPAGLEIYCAIWRPDGSLTKHGPSIEWHTQTRRKSRGEYLENVKIGPWVTWHATGSPDEQGNYIGGKKDGEWETFHSNGAPASKGQFIGGKENGAWTYWNEDSTTRTDAAWIDGKRDGTWLVLDSTTEKPLRERIYANGKLVSQRELALGN